MNHLRLRGVVYETRGGGGGGGGGDTTTRLGERGGDTTSCDESSNSEIIEPVHSLEVPVARIMRKESSRDV